MRPGSTTWVPASNTATGRAGVPPAGTSPVMKPPSTTTPRSAPSARMASGSLIQSALPAAIELPCRCAWPQQTATLDRAQAMA
jgi:hypothetical protein